jgi:hypothetical protein
MARSRLFFLVFVCGLGFQFVVLGASLSDNAFREGFKAYAAGAFTQAAALFRHEVARAPSSGALHNLGNAEWKCGHPGAAILAWEQAQWLNPFGANTRVNLQVARKQAQLGSPELAWYETCSTWLPYNAWAWIACVSFWLALALIILPGIFGWRWTGWHQALAAAAFALFLLTLPALFGVATRSKQGIILVKDTPLRLTPTAEAQVLGRLPAGDIGRIEGERGAYFYIRASNAAAGWVLRSQFGRICER